MKKIIIPVEVMVDDDAADDYELLAEIVEDQLSDQGPIRSAKAVTVGHAVESWFREDWVDYAVHSANEDPDEVDLAESSGGQIAFEGWRDWVGEMTLGIEHRQLLRDRLLAAGFSEEEVEGIEDEP